MNIQPHSSPASIYLLKEGLSQQQLSSAINRCLSQAEALAIIATIIDAEAIGNDSLNNFLWALSDIVHQAKCLHEHLMNTL